MVLKIYGTVHCEDCVECIEKLQQEKIEFIFFDIMQEFDYLKELIQLRDSSPLFDEVKAGGGIGIPCVQKEDGSYTLDWKACLNE